jgi:hypothetical protein
VIHIIQELFGQTLSNSSVADSANGLAYTNALTVNYTVPRSCLRSQVNQTVQQFKKIGRMGTTIDEPKAALEVTGNLFCAGSTRGEWDANLKEIVRLLYLSKATGPTPDYGILDKATVDYMFDKLLSARGEVGKDTFNFLSDCENTANEKTGKIEDVADYDEHADNVLGVLAGAADDVVDAAGDVLGFLPKLFKYAVEVLQKVVVIAVAGSVIGVLVAGDIFDGGMAVAALLFAADPAAAFGLGAPFDLVIEETENHRLMEESARFLINADIISRLRDLKANNVAEFEDDNKGVREWLLRRLQSIAKNDFDEYNSRSYNRYSLRAIRNLYDFSPDADVKTGAKIVLDLAESKFAAGSNLGRRMAPFRRKTHADLSTDQDYAVDLYQWVGSSDDQVVNATLLSGQTQLLRWIDINETDRVGLVLGTTSLVPPPAGTDRLVPGATSTYRLPRAALEAIVERKLPFIQIANHDGRESYYSSPAFLMTTGGIKTRSKIGVTVLDLPDSTDSGIALPTSIMPTGGLPSFDDGRSSRSTFHFRGVGTMDDRTENLCGWKGFICGVAPHVAEFDPINPAEFNPSTPAVRCDGSVNLNVAPSAATASGLKVFYNSAGCDFADSSATGVAIQNNQAPRADITAATKLVSSPNSDSLSVTPRDGSQLTVNGNTITFSAKQANITVVGNNYTIGVGAGAASNIADVISTIDNITSNIGDAVDILTGNADTTSSVNGSGQLVIHTGLASDVDFTGSSPDVLSALGLTGISPIVRGGRPPPSYFMSGRFWNCDGGFCDKGQRYGFMEVVPVPPAPPAPTVLPPYQEKARIAAAFEQFKSDRMSALDAVKPDGSGNATYVNGDGDEITFNMTQSRPKVLTVNGNDVGSLLGSAATGFSGGLINASNGVGTIASLWGSEVVDFDFSDWNAPRSTVRQRRFDETAAFYAQKSGDASAFQFSKYLGVASPTGFGMAGPVVVHPQGMLSTIIPAVGTPVFYTTDSSGDFFWTKSDGAADGSDKWEINTSRIGNGWDNFDQIVAGEQGVLYGRIKPGLEQSGVLRWYRHLGYQDGSISWNEPTNVGDASEWGRFSQLIASSDGVIYGVLPNGDLIWHRHLGFLDGTNSWATPKPVGSGWQGPKAIMSPGCGIIFVLNANGELVRYRHKGYLTGDAVWEGPTVINSGLKAITSMYAVMPNDHPDTDRCNVQ